MLKELIDEFYLGQHKDRLQDHFYVSDAGKCPRAVFFNFKKAPKAPLDARLARIFEKGNKMHNDIFSILYRLKISAVTEVQMPKSAMISGRADAILCINNENYILDIKSMNSFIFKGLKEPKLDNTQQLQLYLHYFNIRKGILLYIDKDRQDFKEFIILYNPMIVQPLLRGLQKLKKQIDNNELPKVLSDYKTNWRCRYCRFSTLCKELHKATQKKTCQKQTQEKIQKK